jgi:hypothetical protein
MTSTVAHGLLACGGRSILPSEDHIDALSSSEFQRRAYAKIEMPLWQRPLGCGMCGHVDM